MENFYVQGIIAIVTACLAVLLLGNLRKKGSAVLLMVQRGIVGFLAILGCNKLFGMLALPLFVGINFWTLLTCFFLGIPGVCMLFCLSMF